MEELFNNLLKIILGDVGGLITTIVIGGFTILSGYIFNRLKKWFKINVIAKWKNGKFNKFIENANTINNLLVELRIRLEADRCMICQFHNGTEFLNENFHTLSFTCLYESVGNGFQPFLEKFKDIKIVNYFDLITKIKDQDIVIYDEKTKKDLTQFQFFSYNFGMNTFTAKILIEKNGGIVGFLMIGWNSEIEITPEHIEYINNFTNTIKFNF